jgi:hypothetical protein
LIRLITVRNRNAIAFAFDYHAYLECLDQKVLVAVVYGHMALEEQKKHPVPTS